MGIPRIILDPEEVSVAGRIQIPLTESEGFKVFYEGIDWGDQEVKQFLAEGVFGSRPIDQVWPLRQIKLPLVIEARGTKSFDEIRAKLQQWVSLVNQSGGGWLKRVLKSGRVGFADIIEAKLDLTSDWLSENRDLDTKATLELQALPDLYGPEITGTAQEFTGDGSFTMQVKGDMPARVTNMQVEDKSGNNQQGLMWHYRRRHYSSANTAEWAYNAEALGLLDIAAKQTLTGSYGTKVVEHPNLSTDWTPVLSTNKAGSTFLTHAGLYDVWARVYSTSEKLPWLRLVYGVGDTVAPQENTQIRIPGAKGFYWVPIGQVNITVLPFGAQRWNGIIQARGELGGENISIDRLRFLCGDESSGVLRNTPGFAIGASTFRWRDEFNQEAGELTGKTAAIGGTYVALTGSDAGPDFATSGSGSLTRSSTSDTGTLL